ncbi:hypothetical protein KC340_g17456 [Hortaea werneckii]|nr:hypothetical protein KC342_g17462 [Hortaea werneckii]KAI7091069.1 hypothetical protein KC339_g12586 [Hortaea werneckii]KAI7207852.1 hypothetical protein KC365_g16351 [Hortaea werneckii]KAI7290272.1 hypothetical protein KC340_g17456 [Hortaea werneckii]KAI7375686.1 hypothetical protein KC328_g15286 [Hortaea werneckii]
MSIIPTTRKLRLHCKRKAENADEFEAERIQPADRQQLVAARVSRDAGMDQKLTGSPNALSAPPQEKQNTTPEIKRPRLVIKLSPQVTESRDGNRPNALCASPQEKRNATSENKRPRLVIKLSPQATRSRDGNQPTELDRHPDQNEPRFNINKVSTAQNREVVFASGSALRSTLRKTPNGTNPATAQPKAKTTGIELPPPRNRNKPISIADLDAQLYPDTITTKRRATPRDHLDVTPDMAGIKRFKRLEHDSAPDGYDLKLPRSLADPKRHGPESGVIDYTKMHDPEKKAPWAPLALFDSRLTKAHEEHALAFEERAKRPATPKDGSKGPDEDDVKDEQVDWVRQKQVARMSSKYRETMRKGFKRTQGDLTLEEQHAGQQPSILDRLRAGELSPEPSPDISGADAQRRAHDVNGQQPGDDVEVTETYRRDEHEHEDDWRVQQLLLGADAPIGIFNRHEVALDRARRAGRAASGKKGWSVCVDDDDDLQRFEARKALVRQGRMPAFPVVDKK